MAWNEPGPGRDPWNQKPGGKRGDGPPDLDELLKRLKARLTGKGGGRAPTGGKLPQGLAGIIAVLLASLWLLSGFYTVDEQERGVVQRFGAYEGTVEPGLRWHLPWPIEHVEHVDFTRLRQVTDRSTMLTQDQNLLDVELTVQYRVSSAEDFYFNVADPDRTLQQAAEASVREVVGRVSVDQALDDGHQNIAEQTRQLLQKRLDVYRSGLAIKAVNFQAQPPDAVKAAFVDAINASSERDSLRNEAQAYANEHLPKARSEAARNLEEAAAYRDRIVARAEGDAARFSALLEEYRKAPKITRERLYLDTMQDIYANTSKVLVDIDKGSPVFTVPLDQLLKNAPKPDAPTDAAVTSAPAAAHNGSRSDDPARPRDRGSR
jgi:membrane protease subunit HflK